MEVLELIGKILFSYLFVTSGIGHFKATSSLVGYAKYKNLPFPKFNVLASGVVIIIAPILFVLGIAEVAALSAIALFLLATAFKFHAFWNETDQQARTNEMLTFNKEISLVGAILVIISIL